MNNKQYPAYLGTRGQAFLIDYLLISIPAILTWTIISFIYYDTVTNLTGQTGPLIIGMLINVTLYTLYCIFMHSYKGATFGKMRFNLQLVDSSGKNISLSRSLLRELCKITFVAGGFFLLLTPISKFIDKTYDGLLFDAAIIFVITTFFWSLLDKNGQTLYDKSSSTYAINTAQQPPKIGFKNYLECFGLAIACYFILTLPVGMLALFLFIIAPFI